MIFKKVSDKKYTMTEKDFVYEMVINLAEQRVSKETFTINGERYHKGITFMVKNNLITLDKEEFLRLRREILKNKKAMSVNEIEERIKQLKLEISKLEISKLEVEKAQFLEARRKQIEEQLMREWKKKNDTN